MRTRATRTRMRASTNPKPTHAHCPTRHHHAVRLAKSYAGVPQPGLHLDFNPRLPPRLMRATQHRILARLEEVTPESERWIATEGRCTSRGGCVYLELAHAKEQETERGLGLLRQVAEETKQ